MTLVGAWETALVLVVLTPILSVVLVRPLRRTAGLVTIITGMLLILTRIGAIIGLPLIFVGAISYLLGIGKGR